MICVLNNYSAVILLCPIKPFYGRGFLDAKGLDEEHGGKPDKNLWFVDDGACYKSCNHVDFRGTNSVVFLVHQEAHSTSISLKSSRILQVFVTS